MVAKVQAPALSLSASGAIGHELVYTHQPPGPVARAHGPLIGPAPTSRQSTQRAHFSSAVTDWHARSWLPLDETSWDLTAVALSRQASRYNAFLREHIRVTRAAQTWRTLRIDSIAVVFTTNLRIRVMQDVPGLLMGAFGSASPDGPWAFLANVGVLGGFYHYQTGFSTFTVRRYVQIATRVGTARYAPTGTIDTALYLP